MSEFEPRRQHGHQAAADIRPQQTTVAKLSVWRGRPPSHVPASQAVVAGHGGGALQDICCCSMVDAAGSTLLRCRGAARHRLAAALTYSRAAASCARFGRELCVFFSFMPLADAIKRVELVLLGKGHK